MDADLLERATALLNKFEVSGWSEEAAIIRSLLAQDSKPRHVVISSWEANAPNYGGAKLRATITTTPIQMTIDMQDDAGNTSSVMVECDRGLATVRSYMPVPAEIRIPEGPNTHGPVLGITFGGDKSAVFLGDDQVRRVFELIDDGAITGSPVESQVYDGEEDAFSSLRIGIRVPPASRDGGQEDRPESAPSPGL